jgi:MOSC domain-containing protein YiiM
MKLRILSVNVAQPRVIGLVNGEPVRSGIDKRPLEKDTVFVGATDIDGDAQADLSVHGGPDKAVYAYPVEHWSWWEREKALACAPGTFGENLTLEGADETELAIGDRFAWGDAILEVSQPRAPCYKFAIHTRRADAPQLMTLSGRCGWYFRVIQEGEAPVAGALLVRISQSGGPHVREAFWAVLDPRAGDEIVRRVHAAPALAEDWRRPLEKRLSGRK